MHIPGDFVLYLFGNRFKSKARELHEFSYDAGQTRQIQSIGCRAKCIIEYFTAKKKKKCTYITSTRIQYDGNSSDSGLSVKE